ncbi:MAG TPA: PhoH family protein, partial [Bacteroidales bacterium]|nr:PhoH family protein [Bacteroidales bacterium]
TRVLDELSGEELFEGGVQLGEGLGKLFIETGKPFGKELISSFPEQIPDHRILAIAQFLRDKNTDRQVVLVTKDINLRVKAKSLGLTAQDYKNDKVANLDNIRKQVAIIEGADKNLISSLYDHPEGIPLEDFNFGIDPIAHQYFVLRNGSNSVLAHYDPFKNVIDRVVKTAAYGIEPRNAEQAFAIDALLRPEIQLVALTGKAGTGKTLLALAAAIHMRKSYLQIFLARPIVSLSNKDIGYLPGDAKEKINPYMQPLFDNLSVIKHKFSQQSADFKRIEEMQKSEKLLIEPLAYIRGRSLSRVFFIIDEAQNLTPHEVKTIITRAGEGTKIVFTGDIQQIDSPYLDSVSNGLSYLAEKMRGQDIFAHINLIKGERSYLAELASDLL